jgi:diguanylate cyclase (GGDEF)-like protein
MAQFVRCILTEIRDTDYIARIGGDEFAIILPESNLEHATRLVTRLERVIAGCPHNLPDKRIVQHSASFGVAIYPEQANNAEDLMSFVDQALYLYKRQKDLDTA